MGGVGCLVLGAWCWGLGLMPSFHRVPLRAGGQAISSQKCEPEGGGCRSLSKRMPTIFFLREILKTQDVVKVGVNPSLQSVDSQR